MSSYETCVLCVLFPRLSHAVAKNDCVIGVRGFRAMIFQVSPSEREPILSLRYSRHQNRAIIVRNRVFQGGRKGLPCDPLRTPMFGAPVNCVDHPGRTSPGCLLSPLLFPLPGPPKKLTPGDLANHCPHFYPQLRRCDIFMLM